MCFIDEVEPDTTNQTVKIVDNFGHFDTVVKILDILDTSDIVVKMAKVHTSQKYPEIPPTQFLVIELFRSIKSRIAAISTPMVP